MRAKKHRNYNWKLMIFLLILVGIFLSLIIRFNLDSNDYYHKGVRYYSSQPEVSETYFLKSIELDNSFEKPYLMLFHYYCVLAGDYVEADEIANAFIKQFPNIGLGYGLKSINYLKEGRSVEQVYNQIEHIDLENPNIVDIELLALGLYSFKIEDLDKGLYFFNESLTTSNTIVMDDGLSFLRVDKLNLILSTLIDYGFIDEAKALIVGIEEDGESYNLGPYQHGDQIIFKRFMSEILMSKGNFEEAKKILLDLEKEFELTDKEGLECSYQSLGLLYYLTNDSVNSSEYYQKYADVAPFRVAAQIEAVQSCLTINDYPCAKKYIERALNLDDTNSESIQLLQLVNSRT